MGDRTRGLFVKFRVTRADGSSEPGGKHHGCAYFVLDLTHDPHAPAALATYADSCEADGYVDLARDLRHEAQMAVVAQARGDHGHPKSKLHRMVRGEPDPDDDGGTT